MAESMAVTKKAIAVLLVVTIFLSLVGTWVFLNAIETRMQAEYQLAQLTDMGSPVGEGNVLITIHNPGFERTTGLGTPMVTGQVIFSINQPDTA
ncbi:MAG: hypothetical protein KJ709_05850 [Nanoarchaeota archaeon]|nr:hypothetical protein [Nanoarchaeota archaeon]